MTRGNRRERRNRVRYERREEGEVWLGSEKQREMVMTKK